MCIRVKLNTAVFIHATNRDWLNDWFRRHGRECCWSPPSLNHRHRRTTADDLPNWYLPSQRVDLLAAGSGHWFTPPRKNSWTQSQETHKWILNSIGVDENVSLREYLCNTATWNEVKVNTDDGKSKTQTNLVSIFFRRYLYHQICKI